MAALILRFLPHLAVAASAAALLLAAMWRIDRAGYDRAVAAIEAENRAQRQRIEQLLAGQMAKEDRRFAEVLDAVHRAERARAIVIEKEIANDPRYADPRCFVGDRVRDALNAALRGDPAAAGRDRE
jgi:hypothetical protein